MIGAGEAALIEALKVVVGASVGDGVVELISTVELTDGGAFIVVLGATTDLFLVLPSKVVGFFLAGLAIFVFSYLSCIV